MRQNYFIMNYGEFLELFARIADVSYSRNKKNQALHENIKQLMDRMFGLID